MVGVARGGILLALLLFMTLPLLPGFSGASDGSPEPGALAAPRFPAGNDPLGPPTIVWPVWRESVPTTFEDRPVSPANGTFIATDGSTFFYATRDPEAGTEEAPARCSNALPPYRIEIVLVNSQPCSWLRHPTIACADGMDPCWEALAMPRRESLEQEPGSEPNEDVPPGEGSSWFHFGVEEIYPSATAVYGYIRMSDQTDTLLDRCNFRWPGLQGDAFVQAGTATCYWFPANQYKRFCFWRAPGGPLVGEFTSSSYAFNSNNIRYDFGRDFSIGNTYWACYLDGQMFAFTDLTLTRITNPKVQAFGEVEFKTGTAATGAFAANTMPYPSVVYCELGCQDPPDMNFKYYPGREEVCVNNGYGVQLVATNHLTPRSSTPLQTYCPEGTAW